jgi:hypothetical protein
MEQIKTWLMMYGALSGLILNFLGAAIVALCQSRLIAVVNAWLNALDFFIETYLNKRGPVVRFEGWDARMEKEIPRNRRLSTLGWILLCIGFALQIPGTLP